jgi:hypothetical protein
MKLWILKRIEEHHQWWDCVAETVVRAESAKAARLLASTSAGAEGSEVWLDPKRSSCRRLREDGPAKVILEDCPPG